jgi:heme A synthase
MVETKERQKSVSKERSQYMGESQVALQFVGFLFAIIGIPVLCWAIYCKVKWEKIFKDKKYGYIPAYAGAYITMLLSRNYGISMLGVDNAVFNMMYKMHTGLLVLVVILLVVELIRYSYLKTKKAQ